jgi:hypothetical protein
MSIALILALAAAPVSADKVTIAPVGCELIASDGSTLRFGIQAKNSKAKLTPVAGGGWPATAMAGMASLKPGTKLVDVDIGAGSARLELRPIRNAEQVPAEAMLNGPGGFPIAVGYCGTGSTGASAAVASSDRFLADLEAKADFNGSCLVMAEDGRRTTIRLSAPDGGGTMLEPQDAGIWEKKVYTFSNVAAPPGVDPAIVHQVVFMPKPGLADGPWGDEAIYRSTDGKKGSIVLSFWRVDANKPEKRAVAHCGVGNFGAKG